MVVAVGCPGVVVVVVGCRRDSDSAEIKYKAQSADD